MIVAVPPKVDCEKGGYRKKTPVYVSWQTRLDYRMFVRGIERCLALIHPLELVTNRVLRNCINEAAPFIRQSALPTVKLLDWALDENPCLRSEGTHMDVLHPVCRDYTIRRLYSFFL